MERTTITERLAAEENARMQKASRDVDFESQINWEKLLELASDRPGPLVSIARARAPEASARVLRDTKAT